MKNTTTRNTPNKSIMSWIGYYKTTDLLFALINQKANRAAIKAKRTRRERKALILALCKKAKLNAAQCADILENSKRCNPAR